MVINKHPVCTDGTRFCILVNTGAVFQ